MTPADSTPGERAHGLVDRVLEALGLEAEVVLTEDEERLQVDLRGEDLGLVIGRHGQTIDALQHLVHRAAYRGEGPRKRVEVDAAGYRDRRAAALHHDADRAADDAVRLDRPVELEPMSAVERRLVHEYLRDRDDVGTHSEGEEPNRRLVVSPPER